jgi:hypothetical protein
LNVVIGDGKMKNFNKLVFTGIILSVITSNVSAFPALTPKVTEAIVQDFKTPNYSQLFDRPASEVILGVQHLVANTAKVEDIVKNLKLAIEDRYKAEDKKEVKAAWLKTLESLKKLTPEEIKSKEFTTKLFKDFTDTELKALGIDRKDIAAVAPITPTNFSTGLTGEVKEQFNTLLCQIEDMERKRVEDEQKHFQALQDLLVKAQKSKSEFDPKELLKQQQEKDKNKFDEMFAKLFAEPKKDEEKKAEVAPNVSPMPNAAPKKDDKKEDESALDKEIPKDKPPVERPQVGFEEVEPSKVQPTFKTALVTGKKELDALDNQVDSSKAAVSSAKTALNNPLVTNPQSIAMLFANNPIAGMAAQKALVQKLRDELVKVKTEKESNAEALKDAKKAGKKIDDTVNKASQDASKLINDRGETKRFEQLVAEKKEAQKDAQERLSKCRSEQECAVLEGIAEAAGEALKDAKKKQTLVKNSVDKKVQEAVEIAEEARTNKEDIDDSTKDLKKLESELTSQQEKLEAALTSLTAPAPQPQQPQGVSLSNALAGKGGSGTQGPALGNKDVRN